MKHKIVNFFSPRLQRRWQLDVIGRLFGIIMADFSVLSSLPIYPHPFNPLTYHRIRYYIVV